MFSKGHSYIWHLCTFLKHNTPTSEKCQKRLLRTIDNARTNEEPEAVTTWRALQPNDAFDSFTLGLDSATFAGVRDTVFLA